MATTKICVCNKKTITATVSGNLISSFKITEKLPTFSF